MIINFKADWQTANTLLQAYAGYLGPLIMAALERFALRAPLTELGTLMGVRITFKDNTVSIESGRGALVLSLKDEGFEVEISPTRSAG